MLILLPNVLDTEQSPRSLVPVEVVSTIQGLIAESEREARRFLRSFSLQRPIVLLNEHTRDYEFLLEPLIRGETWGLISDCGLPCLADPGSELVYKTRILGIPVQAFSGPSSIILALMLSGLPSQNFSFHGYLERESPLLVKQLMALQKRKETHICIETPYRNLKLLDTLIKTLGDTALLCVAWDLTMHTQGVMTHSIREWKKQSVPDIHKKPAVFLFSRGEEDRSV